MEIKQNLRPYIEDVKTIYTSHTTKTQAEYEYTFFSNWNLEKSFACLEDNKLIGFVAVSEKTGIDEHNLYQIALLEDAYFINEEAKQQYKKILLEQAFTHLNPFYDSICIHSHNWDSVHSDLMLEDTLIVHECSFVKGEYPTPMIMTWSKPEPGLMAGIESLDGVNRIGIQRPLDQISLDIRCHENKDLSFLANPYGYVWYEPQTKQIDSFTYQEACHLTWLLNQIQPEGSFYMYANEDLSELPNIKIVKKDIILVKSFIQSKKQIKNVKFIDL